MRKLAFLGTNEGNGHIFSWSAIINGKYDEQLMKECGYPVIYEYLSKNKKDIGSNHLKLAKPFIEENIPVFIDKPLTDNEKDLKKFIEYFKEGKPILSSSSYRYSKNIDDFLKENTDKIEFVRCIMNKTWERYGVHAMEGLYKIMGSGIKSVINLGDKNINVVYIEYSDERKAVIENIYNSKITDYDIITPKNTYTIDDTNTFYMFKKQMETFIRFINERKYPYPYEETIEITKVIIGGIISREEKRKVELKEILY